MRIVFINAYDVTGGAGIAVYRLYSWLRLRRNTENILLAGTKKSSDPSVIPTVPAGILRFGERGINYLLARGFGLQYKFFPFSAPKIVATIKQFQPDVIHLHNIHGAYFQTSLIKTLSQFAPVVWTLHDMWAFTANAAHTFGNESWKQLGTFPGERKLFPQIGLPTGRWLLKQKKKIYSASHLTIVTPSQWLFTLAQQSPVFKGKRIFHIPNGIDTSKYVPMDKSAVRRELLIPENAKVLFFSAEHINRDDFKGGRMLLESLRSLHAQLSEQIHIIMIGAGGFSDLHGMEKFTVHTTGYVTGEDVMVKYINAADLLLYPTKADNLPNSLVEAIACGLPAITYDVGGCKEIIRDGENGWVVPEGSIEIFTKKILETLFNAELLKKFSGNARRIAEELYSLENVGPKYYELYLQLRKDFTAANF